MPLRRILIFGGTKDARELASLLVTDGFFVVTTLAGVTQVPLLPPGEVHRGRLGGVEGIVRYASGQEFDAIVDATHPFAARLARSAMDAAELLRLPYFRLERPPWTAEAGDQWLKVMDFEEALAAVAKNSRVLLTVGRREIASFLARADLSGVVRMIEEPDVELPASWRLLRARPPFTVADELRLFDEERISVLITKNAGGEDTRPKLIAARERKIPVIMVARPGKPPAPTYPGAQALRKALNA